VLEDRLLTAQAGDSRRRQLERRVASLQAEVIAKDRTLQSECQWTLRVENTCSHPFITVHYSFLQSTYLF